MGPPAPPQTRLGEPFQTSCCVVHIYSILPKCCCQVLLAGLRCREREGRGVELTNAHAGAQERTACTVGHPSLWDFLGLGCAQLLVNA